LGRAFLDITDFPEKEAHQHASVRVRRCHPADAQDAHAALGPLAWIDDDDRVEVTADTGRLR